MYKNVKRTCRAIVLLIKPTVLWCLYRCRRRQSLRMSKTRARTVPNKPRAFIVSLHFYMLDNART